MPKTKGSESVVRDFRALSRESQSFALWAINKAYNEDGTATARAAKAKKQPSKKRKSPEAVEAKAAS